MEVVDSIMCRNRDWDPLYLVDIFNQYFYDYTDLWKSNIEDSDIISKVEKVENIYLLWRTFLWMMKHYVQHYRR